MTSWLHTKLSSAQYTVSQRNYAKFIFVISNVRWYRSIFTIIYKTGSAYKKRQKPYYSWTSNSNSINAQRDCNTVSLPLYIGKTQQNMNTFASQQHRGPTNLLCVWDFNTLAQSQLYQRNADWPRACTHHASSFHWRNVATQHDWKLL